MKIAVLLATYNGEKYLTEQIKSLLSQSFSEFEIYAHDDGSTDNTVSILRSFEEKCSHKIHVLQYEKTGGARNNFFSMLKRIDADYYLFCDQDDIWLPTKIEDTYNRIVCDEKKNTGLPCLVFTDLVIVNEDLQVIEESFMDYWKICPEKYGLNMLMCDNIAPGCTMIINRRCRDLAIQIKDIENFKMHDHLVMLISKLCGNVTYLNEKTVLYRQHGGNVVGIEKMSTKQWLKEKTSNILHGEQLKSSQRIFEDQKRIINELTLFRCVKPEYQQMMKDLGTFSYVGKIERMRIYRRYRLLGDRWLNRWKIILA